MLLTSISKEPPKAILLIAFEQTLGSGMDLGLHNSTHNSLLQLPSYQGTKWYKLLSRSILSSFERTFPAAQTWLAIHAFSSNELSWDEMKTSSGTEWARRNLTGVRDMEGGSFTLNRVYE